MMSKSLFALGMAALPALTNAAIPASTTPGVNVYWGQSGTADLASYCDSDAFEYISLAFVVSSPEQDTSGLNYPGTNFPGHCPYVYYKNPANGVSSPLLSSCTQIAADIKTCQQKSKKVVLSIGGVFGPSANYTVSTPKKGLDFADFLWGSFGPVDPAYTGPRPFGDTVVDGFDFDIETGDFAMSGYIALLQRLRQHYKAASGKYLITGAPECPLNDPYFYMKDIFAASGVIFDILWIQFYNNAGCDAVTGNTPWEEHFNYDDWVSYLQGTDSKDAQIFIGLSGSPGDHPFESGYLSPEDAYALLTQYKGSSNFGGAMVWDLVSASAVGNNGRTYYENLHDALYGKVVPPTSTRTTTTSTTTTTSAPTGPPTCSEFYTIQPGEYCWLIANNLGISVDDLRALNPDVLGLDVNPECNVYGFEVIRVKPAGTCPPVTSTTTTTTTTSSSSTSSTSTSATPTSTSTSSTSSSTSTSSTSTSTSTSTTSSSTSTSTSSTSTSTSSSSTESSTSYPVTSSSTSTTSSSTESSTSYPVTSSTSSTTESSTSYPVTSSTSSSTETSSTSSSTETSTSYPVTSSTSTVSTETSTSYPVTTETSTSVSTESSSSTTCTESSTVVSTESASSTTCTESTTAVSTETSTSSAVTSSVSASSTATSATYPATTETSTAVSTEYPVTSSTAVSTEYPVTSSTTCTESHAETTTSLSTSYYAPTTTSYTSWSNATSTGSPSSSYGDWTSSTVTETKTRTITSCAPTVTNCPAGSTIVTTETTTYVTVCPVTELPTSSAYPTSVPVGPGGGVKENYPSSSVSYILPTGGNGGNGGNGGGSGYPTGGSGCNGANCPKTTATVTATSVTTVTVPKGGASTTAPYGGSSSAGNHTTPAGTGYPTGGKATTTTAVHAGAGRAGATLGFVGAMAAIVLML